MSKPKTNPYHPGLPAGNLDKHPNQDPATKGPYHPPAPKPQAVKLPGGATAKPVTLPTMGGKR